MKSLKIALLGMGTVGGGVFSVLQRNRAEIARRLGQTLDIVAIADLNTARVRSQLGGADVLVTEDARALMLRPDIDVVVELVGGCGVARELVLAAIAAGKHVVTANKALLALHGEEIFRAAAQNGVTVAFEAAVAGGIPIIKALREGLTANRIEWVAGIINGTTNFILSEMRAKGIDFATALKQAQQLGYAEADPTFDIEGVDAAHKITLMAAMAFGVPVQFGRVHVEGISRLQAADIRHAEQLGCRIKLLGVARRGSSARGQPGLELRVHPALVPMHSLLASVEGATNAVLVHGNAVGTTLYCGQGAGAEPTASAVIADLVDLARQHRVPPLAFAPEGMDIAQLPVLPLEEVQTSYYLRIRVADQSGVLARIAAILAQADISIDALLQRPAEAPGTDSQDSTDLIVLTHATREGQLDAALAHIQQLLSVLAPVVRIRKEEL